jgi:RNA polymerase sigma factor (sigma-70 family)
MGAAAAITHNIIDSGSKPVTGLASGRTVTQAQTPTEDVRDIEVGNLFAAHRDQLHRFLVAHGCTEAEADEIVQDTILVVRRQWDRVRLLEKPKAYWYKVASRQMWRLQKKRDKILHDADETLRRLPDPIDRIEQVDEARALMELFRQLPPKQGRVLWLRIVEGFSQAETADILSISAGTVKSQLHDAKANLGKLVEKNSRTWEGDI